MAHSMVGKLILAVGKKSQLLPTWTLYRTLNVFTMCWLASSGVGNPRESNAEAAMLCMTLQVIHYHFPHIPLVIQTNADEMCKRTTQGHKY